LCIKALRYDIDTYAMPQYICMQAFAQALFGPKQGAIFHPQKWCGANQLVHDVKASGMINQPESHSGVTATTERLLLTSKEVAKVTQNSAQGVHPPGHALSKPASCIGSQPGPG